MSRPKVFCTGTGSREVYYVRLSHGLTLKAKWNGDEDVVSEDIPPGLPLATSIPRPVEEKIKIAFRIASMCSERSMMLEREVSILRERETMLRSEIEKIPLQDGWRTSILKLFKGA